jgi:cobalt/nickel transport system ATP-binding protein
VEQPAARPPAGHPAGHPAVRIDDLYYTYGDGTPALRGVSLEIVAGESVCLVGPNGAGKSTLIMHLNGTLPGTSGGRVKIHGQSAEKKNLREIRRRVGVVFQDPDDQLFSPTVAEDVAFGPANQGLAGEALERRVAEALGRVGVDPGLKERISHHLSFGEKKRVAIATVLAMEVSVLVLDEPTSNLDPAGRRALIELLKSLEMTKLIATHDLELALEVCPRMVLLDGGRVAADGPTPALLADSSLMAAHRLEVPLSLRPARGR